MNFHDPDPLLIVLLVAAFGLAFLPILVLAGASASQIGAVGGVYGTALAVVAPLVARRRKSDDREDRDGGNRDR